MTGGGSKANETAFIGCRYGYGGADEFGDKDLLAEGQQWRYQSAETAGFLHTLAGNHGERAIGETMGQGLPGLRRIQGIP